MKLQNTKRSVDDAVTSMGKAETREGIDGRGTFLDVLAARTKLVRLYFFLPRKAHLSYRLCKRIRSRYNGYSSDLKRGIEGTAIWHALKKSFANRGVDIYLHPNPSEIDISFRRS